jgi:hypothetical protein
VTLFPPLSDFFDSDKFYGFFRAHCEVLIEQIAAYLFFKLFFIRFQSFPFQLLVKNVCNLKKFLPFKKHRCYVERIV